MKTPKPHTPELAALRERLGAVLSSESLEVVAWGVLGRERVIQIIGKLTHAAPADLERVSTRDLVRQVVGAFFRREDGAFTVIRELDRATRTEQALVASLPTKDVPGRLRDHGVLRLRRHGAKLVWAVLRDERPELGPLRKEMLERYLQTSRRIEQAREAARQKGAEAELDQVEDVYRSAAERALDLEGRISEVERERARLSADLGKREMELRRQESERRGLAARLAELERALAAHGTGPLPADGGGASRGDLEAARARVAELEEENGALRKALDRLRERRAIERGEGSGARPAPPAAKAAETSKTAPVVEAPRRGRAKHGSPDVRVGVFVDVANLSGAARRLYGGAVDYRQLLATLGGGRRLVEARAYAIDKGRAFEQFARALRTAGYRVYSKKPKVFPDGEMKADWDVGITVDLLTRHDRLDVVVLASGDGDYAPAVAALRKLGLVVEAAAFPDRAATELEKAVDRFFELDATVLEAG